MDDTTAKQALARRGLGEAGEAAAGRWLLRCGLTIVARGYRSRFGEIDLVARDGSLVVFVEVKTRTQSGFGRPCEAVTRAKRARLIRTAGIFLARRGWADAPCRFDVVEMEPRGGRWHVTHIADAFRPGD
jgi:putative endonuclease